MRHVLFLDLKDDDELIESYKNHHRNFPKAIEMSIKTAGITEMEIFLTGNRMAMIMEVTDEFNFNFKAKSDAENPEVQAWEALMWRFQKALPHAKEGEKWVLSQRIFKL